MSVLIFEGNSPNVHEIILKINIFVITPLTEYFSERISSDIPTTVMGPKPFFSEMKPFT